MSSALALVDVTTRPGSKSKVKTCCSGCKKTRVVVYVELVRTLNRQLKYTPVVLCPKCYRALPALRAELSSKSAAGLANRPEDVKKQHYQNIRDAHNTPEFKQKLKSRPGHSEASKKRISEVITAKFRDDHEYVAKTKMARKRYWDKDEYRAARTWTVERFIAEAIAVHGDRYDYSEVVYINSDHKVAIKCRKHGFFSQLPPHHIHFANGCPSCAGEATSSGPERGISDWLISVGERVINNDRNALGGAELDIYLPDRKLAIEYHGLYWHSYAQQETGPQRYRHHFKRTLADRHGITLLQFYEDEWREKQAVIKSMIANRIGRSSRIYARKCELGPVDNPKLFFDHNHLQGHRDAATIFGLHADGRVVAALSMSKHQDGGYEVIRFANALNMTVVGGFSRLLKYAISELATSRIFTYVDRRYGNGSSYLKAGFMQLGITPPGYRYTKNGITYSRTKFQKCMLAQRLDKFDNNLTEAENMFANGYRRIWDAGHYRLELKLGEL